MVVMKSLRGRPREALRLSPSPVGRGVGVRVRFPDGIPDRVDHCFCLLQRVVVPESQDSPALCFEITGSHRIRLFAVLRSVEFHDQFHGYAAEVGAVGWDRVLARSEERSVGEESVGTCNFRWCTDHSKKTK